MFIKITPVSDDTAAAEFADVTERIHIGTIESYRSIHKTAEGIIEGLETANSNTAITLSNGKILKVLELVEEIDLKLTEKGLLL